MNIIDSAVKWAVGIASDDSHGYDQVNRWGPDYDCSSLVIAAYEQAGVPVKTKGATYTGNMKTVFISCGFVEVPVTSRQKGDVLLYHNSKTGKGHTALMIDFKNLVQASINENGQIAGGKKGDQTGREILTRSYYSYGSSGWSCCLRYNGGVADDAPRNLKRGCKGDDVAQLQSDLNKIAKAGLEVDGDFGKLTDAAVRAFQRAQGLEVDGIVGKLTRAALEAVLGAISREAAVTFQKVVNVRTALNVRTSPELSNNIIGVLYGGHVVDCVEDAGGWTKIKYNGKFAYVSTQYLV